MLAVRTRTGPGGRGAHENRTRYGTGQGPRGRSRPGGRTGRSDGGEIDGRDPSRCLTTETHRRIESRGDRANETGEAAKGKTGSVGAENPIGKGAVARGYRVRAEACEEGESARCQQ